MDFELGHNIKYLRRKHKMSQQELGDLLNVTKVSVCCYEHGTRMPCLEVLIKISDIFKVGLDDLVRGKVE